MSKNTDSVIATGLPIDSAPIAALPHRMTVSTEFLQLVDLKARVARRLADLTAVMERGDPHNVVLLPKSGMRLRAMRPGAFVFDGGPGRC